MEGDLYGLIGGHLCEVLIAFVDILIGIKGALDIDLHLIDEVFGRIWFEFVGDEPSDSDSTDNRPGYADC